MDSNNDGVGDINGLISRLDYLKKLGVDGVWLSPIYESPMKDFGYDVSNYYGIDSVFGTLNDFDRLVNELHARNIKLIMDLVLNHTSDQHPWFIESKSSKQNPKRDWYIWRDPAADGLPPNDWQGDFGGSAWTYEPATNQYYLHSFLEQQPDLNWANPEVQMAIQQVMRFWYGRGVDGFRVDAILFSSKNLDIKQTLYRQKAHEKDVLAQDFAAAFNRGADQHLREYIEVLSSTTKEFRDRCLFLEAYPDPGREDPLGYVGLYDYFDNTVDQVFYFGMLNAADGWDAQKFKYHIHTFQHALKPESTPAYVLGNHDRPRIASRIGVNAARTAAMALLTLPGTKFIYYGDEIGMVNANIPTDQLKDPSNINRDMVRTPMQWTAGEYAGFSDSQPWLPVNPNYSQLNVEYETQDERSILALYCKLLALRVEFPVLMEGRYELEEVAHPRIFSYKRILSDKSMLIIINFSPKSVMFDTARSSGVLRLSSYLDIDEKVVQLSSVQLRPNEGWIVELKD